MKIIKWTIGALILIIVFYMIMVYTIPIKIGRFPKKYDYEVINPYGGPQILDDNDIENLISYLEKNKFTRVPEPSYTFDSTKTIIININAKSEPFVPIHLYHLVYNSNKSFLQFDLNKYYEFNDDDIKFLNQIFNLINN